MSDKRAKKDKKEHSKKEQKNVRKIPQLKLDNGVEIPARMAYMKDNFKCFKINEIEINKIRVSGKKLYSKKHNLYKYYLLYEHDNKYVPLRILLKDVIGEYRVYRDGEGNKDNKSMGFKLDGDSLRKVFNIFEYISDKKDIALKDFTYEIKGEDYCKTKVNDETCFKKRCSEAKAVYCIKPEEILSILVEYCYIYNLFFHYER